MFRFSRGDKLCLTVLLCLDVSLGIWWGRSHESEASAEDLPPTEIFDDAAAPAIPKPIALKHQPAAQSTITNIVDAADEQSDFKPHLCWQHSYGNYRVFVFANAEEEQTLHIFQNNIEVYTDESHLYMDPEGNNEYAEVQNPAPLTDLTGEGLPCLVVESYSGGAHCCTDYDVFQLGPEFKSLGTINAEHGRATFVDLDGDGIPEVLLQDWSYAYGFTCFAASPAPTKILKYSIEIGQYIYATDLHFSDPPTEEEFADLVQEVQEAYTPETNSGEAVVSPGEWGGDAKLWGVMLDLTYAGHLEHAMQLFDKCWHPDWPDKEKALNTFWERVGQSDYGRAVVFNQGYVLPEPTPEPDPNTESESVSSPPEDGRAYHIVDIGESLASIAKQHGVTVDALIKANNITDSKRVYVSQKLVIP